MSTRENAKNAALNAMYTAFASMMATTKDIAFIKDANLRYVCASQTLANTLGLESARDIIGKNDYELTDKALADSYVAVDKQILETGRAQLDILERMAFKGEQPRYASSCKYPLFDASGEVAGIFCIGRDITEARETLNRLEMLADNIPGGLASFEISPRGARLIYFNEGFYDFSGYDRHTFAQMAARDPLCLVLEEDAEAIREAARTLKNVGDKVAECQYRCVTKQGEYRWFSMKGQVSEAHGDTRVLNAVQFDITQRKLAEDRLRISEEQFRIAVNISERDVARYDIKTRTYHNNNALLMAMGFGSKIHNVPQAFLDAGLVMPECADECVDYYNRMASGAPSVSSNIALRVPDGTYRWFRSEATIIFDAAGAPSEAIIVFHDITEQREKEAAYKKFKRSLEEKPLDSYTLFRCNLSKNASFDSVEGELLRFRFSGEGGNFMGRTLEYAESCVHNEDRDDYLAMLNSDTLLAGYYRGKRTHTIEYREIVVEGGFRWLRLTIELLEYPDSTDVEAYLMFENIDAQKQEALKSKALAETDALTGVYNRAAFIEKVSVALGEGGSHAILMLDIDGFKLLNDSFGHATGDQALIDIAAALRSALRKGDLLGRLGGDEFMLFIRDIDDEAAIERKAQKICALLRRAFSLEVQISASIGIARYPVDGVSFEALYFCADTALYHVKATGKDNFAFFKEGMSDESPNPKHITTPTDARGAQVKRRMLIVDDNQLNCDMLEQLFKDEFIIDIANDGNAALIRLRRYGASISVVLLDLIMPGMDGFAVLDKMRAHTEMRSIPVIVVSGVNEREASLRTIKCGASDFVTKPVDPDLIKLRVQSAISKAENERLRAQNSFLALKSGEAAKYRAVLEATDTVIIEHDWEKNTFVYDARISKYISGKFDRRKLYTILKADGVASDADIKRLKKLIHDIATDTPSAKNRVKIALKTPNAETHDFSVSVCKLLDDTQEKLIITLSDTQL